jgi:hypothetical protein
MRKPRERDSWEYLRVYRRIILKLSRFIWAGIGTSGGTFVGIVMKVRVP